MVEGMKTLQFFFFFFFLQISLGNLEVCLENCIRKIIKYVKNSRFQKVHYPIVSKKKTPKKDPESLSFHAKAQN